MSQAMTKLKDAGMLMICLGIARRKATGLVGSQYDVLRHWTNRTEVPKSGPANLMARTGLQDMTHCCQGREARTGLQDSSATSGASLEPGVCKWFH